MKPKSSKSEVKVVIIGDTNAGKSTFINCLIDGPRGFQGAEQQQTRGWVNKPILLLIILGVEFFYQRFIVDRKLCKVGIWDAVGVEKYRAVNSALYRKAQGALLLADLSDENLEGNLEYWMNEFKEKAEPDAPLFLVGNKCDLEENSCTLERLIEFSEKYNIPFYKTSARFGENVHAVMENLLNIINEKNENYYEEILRRKPTMSFNIVNEMISKDFARRSPTRQRCSLN